MSRLDNYLEANTSFYKREEWVSKELQRRLAPIITLLKLEAIAPLLSFEVYDKERRPLIVERPYKGQPEAVRFWRVSYADKPVPCYASLDLAGKKLCFELVYETDSKDEIVKTCGITVCLTTKEAEPVDLLVIGDEGIWRLDSTTGAYYPDSLPESEVLFFLHRRILPLLKDVPSDDPFAFWDEMVSEIEKEQHLENTIAWEKAERERTLLTAKALAKTLDLDPEGFIYQEPDKENYPTLARLILREDIDLFIVPNRPGGLNCAYPDTPGFFGYTCYLECNVGLRARTRIFDISMKVIEEEVKTKTFFKGTRTRLVKRAGLWITHPHGSDYLREEMAKKIFAEELVAMTKQSDYLLHEAAERFSLAGQKPKELSASSTPALAQSARQSIFRR